MKIASNKYAMAFVILGILFMLIPGLVLYLLGYTKQGELLIMAYCIPVLMWAVVALISLGIELFRDWKDYD